MDRADAERVFSLVAEIGSDLRGRIVSERWWLVWIAVGTDMLLACAVLQWWIWRGEDRPAALAGLLAGNVAVLFLILRFIHRRAGGQRTATEGYLWWIWTTKILGTFGVVLFDLLSGRPPFASAAVFPLFAAFLVAVCAVMVLLRLGLYYRLTHVPRAARQL